MPTHAVEIAKGIIDKNTLGDTSPFAPAIASLNGRLYIAWAGNYNHQLNVMSSADNGRTFGNKYISQETSGCGPDLCVTTDGRLFIAWKGDGNDNLNVAQVAVSGERVTGFTQKVTLGDTSPFSPALAAVNNRVFIAWTGNDNHQLNIMYSDDGRNFGKKYISSENSPQGPSLSIAEVELFISWNGSDNDNLNVAAVDCVGGNIGITSAITGFVPKTVLSETSPDSPSIARCGANGLVYIAWTGNRNYKLNVMNELGGGMNFGNKYISQESSLKSPKLCGHNAGVYVAWTGNGNDNLNVALVELS